MNAKPKLVVVFSIIPKLGELVKQSLPLENVKVVNFQAPMSAKYSCKVSEEDVAQLQEAEVLLADTNVFVQMADRLPALRWFQGTWAGMEGLMEHFRGKPSPSYLMTRMSSSSFNQLMAEYAVGQIIVHERNWREADRRQAQCTWHHSGRVAEYRSLRELTVAVLGTGLVGTEIARALKVFGCHVLGYSRTPHIQHQYFDKHYVGADLCTVLSSSDYIVSCLPNTPCTTGLLGGRTLRTVKPGSIFINIGRSNVVAEADLLAALDDGPLAGAVLDVFHAEPLPPDSPLWRHPKVVVTPHCAGVSRATDVAATFVDNFAKYCQGQPLDFTVELQRGY